MKTIPVIAVLVLFIVLSIFTTLYFTKPRVVEVGIPEVIHITHPPSPPDTIYIAKLDTIYIDYYTALHPGDDIAPIWVSEKSFSRTFPIGTVQSDITIYGAAPADSISNHIILSMNKEEIARQIELEVKKRKGSNLRTGIIIGVGAATVLGITGVLISK